MRSAEMVLGRLEDRRHLSATPVPHTPKSSAATPVAVAPHPPLVSGGWYHSLAGKEVVGPGRYAVRQPKEKSVGAALGWTLCFGPLGLCYLSTAIGLGATALTGAVLLLSGSALTLAVVWPLVIMSAVLHVMSRG